MQVDCKPVLYNVDSSAFKTLQKNHGNGPIIMEIRTFLFTFLIATACKQLRRYL